VSPNFFNHAFLRFLTLQSAISPPQITTGYLSFWQAVFIYSEVVTKSTADNGLGLFRFLVFWRCASGGNGVIYLGVIAEKSF
jgi:hypothetical protein